MIEKFKNLILASHFNSLNQEFSILIPTIFMTLIMGDFSIYVSILIICLFPVFVFGEKYIIFCIIVTLFTLVGDLGESLRSTVQFINFTLLFILFLKHYGLNFSQYPKLPKSLNAFIMLYYFSMFLSVILSPHFQAGIQKIVRQTEFFIVAYFLFSLIRSEDLLRTILKAFITASIIIVFSSFVNFYSEGFALSDYGMGKEIRVTGLMSNILATSTFYVIAAPLVIAFLIQTQNKRIKIILWSCIVLLILGILLTASRSAVFSVILSTSFIFYYYHRKLIISFFSILTFISLIIFFTPSLNHISSIVLRTEAGLSQRQHYWTMAYNMIEDNLLFGIGPGSYGYEMYNYFPVMRDSWIGKVIINVNEITEGSNNSHNYFLVFISDLGVPGFILSLMLPIVFFSVTITTLKMYERVERKTFYCLVGVSAAGSSMFVKAMIDGLGILSYGFISADMPFWLMFMGIIFFYLKKQNENHSKVIQTVL